MRFPFVCIIGNPPSLRFLRLSFCGLCVGKKIPHKKRKVNWIVNAQTSNFGQTRCCPCYLQSDNKTKPYNDVHRATEGMANDSAKHYNMVENSKCELIDS